MNPDRIVWLASYPKSGNTWLRTFLHALVNDGPINLNKLNVGHIFSSKTVLEDVLDLESDLLTNMEIETYRRIAYSHVTNEAEKTVFIKIHDAYTYSRWDGLPLVPTVGSKLAIYLVRNPLDVVLSFANHNGKDYQHTIDHYLNSGEGAFIKKRKSVSQFYQLMGNWSMHVNSWLEQDRIPVHVVRYEDMISKPFETFSGITDAIGMDVSDEQVTSAIERTQFNKIKELEEAYGFREKSIPASSFFFHGRVGRWKTELNPQQVRQIRTVHEKMMKKLRYWEEE